MKISEYGRNVQKMVAHIKTLESKEERTLAANTVISVMIALNPSIKEQSEYRIKLWDHLFMIADYDLDVDSPYPIPERPSPDARPVKPAYASNHIRYRYYGKNVERMIRHALEMEDGPQKDAFVNSIASYMKMAYRMWNEDKVPDDVIIKHMAELTNGKILLDHINDIHAGVETLQPQQQRSKQGTQKRSQQQQQHSRNAGGKKNFRRNN